MDILSNLDWQNITGSQAILLIVISCGMLIGIIVFVSFLRMMQDVREIRKILERQLDTSGVEATIKLDSEKHE